MINIRCYYRNGDTINTMFNGSIENANDYFIGNTFNLGVIKDDIQECYRVELIKKRSV